MTVDIVVAMGVTGTFVGIIGTFFGFKKSRDKDIREEVKTITKMSDDISNMRNSIEEIKVSIKEMMTVQKSDHDEIVKVRESSKQAHKRIDQLPEGCGNAFVSKLL